MDSLQIAVLVIIHQISLAGGVVTITFDDNGYIGQSIVLQCKTNDTFIANNGVWFINGRLISSITSGRYSEIKTPDGFNLTISDLTTAHAGYYRCVIDFGSSSNKTLGILYNTSIEITDNPSTFAVTITIIAYPAPEYSVTLTKNGSLVTVTWASTNITRPDGAFKITLISTLMEMDYELTVDVTRTVPAFRRYFVKFAPPPKNETKCELELGLGLGLSLVIQCAIAGIDVGIFIYTSYKYAYYSGLVLGVCLDVTVHVCWIIIVSLISTGNKCKLELGLGLGLGSGVPDVTASVIAVTFTFFSFSRFKNIPHRVELGKGMLTGILSGTVIGIIVVYFIYGILKPEQKSIKPDDNAGTPDDTKSVEVCLGLAVTISKTTNSGSSSAVSRDQVDVQMEERPPAVHIGTQNKVDPNSRPVNGRQQPSPPANTGSEDTPKHRPQPQPPQNGEIKDRNLRGISATISDTLDLASETPRPNRLTPLTPKQETVQEEFASEKPQKKKRKNKKKKDQMTEKTPEDENGGTV